jgi:superfamily II DNA or RNA helicase
MSLEKRCARELSAPEWSKGRAYLYGNRVRELECDATSATAKVKGSARSPYLVMIDWSEAQSERFLGAGCTCPRYDDVGSCKHIAATLLEMDRQGLAENVPGQGRLTIVEPNAWIGEGEYADPADDADLGDADDNWDDQYLPPFGSNSIPAAAAFNRRTNRPSAKPKDDWKQRLTAIRAKLESELLGRQSAPSSAATKKPRDIFYCLNLEQAKSGRFVVDLLQRERLAEGKRGKIKPLNVSQNDLALHGEMDRDLLGLLLLAPVVYSGYGWYPSYYSGDRASKYCVREELAEFILPRLCASGRFGLPAPPDSASPITPLAWDHGAEWQFRLRAAAGPTPKSWRVSGELFCEADSADPADAILIGQRAVVIAGRAARLAAGVSATWLSHLARSGPILIRHNEVDSFVTEFCGLSELPPLEWPAEWSWTTLRSAPKPCVKITSRTHGRINADFTAKVRFQYEGLVVELSDTRAAVVDSERRCLLARDRAAEAAYAAQLRTFGFRNPGYYSDCDAELARRKFSAAVDQLLAAGWHVEADGQSVRTPGAITINVKSGVDWFDLEGGCDFGGVTATLPELLAAVDQGKDFVVLGDGSRGMLPAEWLKRYAPLADFGESKEGVLRFSTTQAALLDALLAAQPNVQYDVAFTRVRRKLNEFAGIAPTQEPATFAGTLRDYQREGLGWLNFLREFGWGGCLADDMGLGKTVQVLALLESRRTRRTTSGQGRRPSLVVVPKSLVFNWLDEAKRFTPRLRTLDYTGLDRAVRLEQTPQCDLIVTTYGTLRRDVVKLREMRFDYVILDESQAIKNAASQSAKACRLLQADHRLAMTGTPVENHLDELWSLFEFLNPGMLGRGRLSALAGKTRGGDGVSLELLRKALRPYMLRRTKQQVLRELPEKTEQTLHCSLEGDQLRYYQELRDHYRAVLTKQIDKLGIKKSKIHVLEALLRLRQAACHPGLINSNQASSSSAKLDLLLEQLREVFAEGHKALVFSQFTSLLAIVRQSLDREKIVYEYLDGKTRDRQARVTRFQSDSDCRLFLISLKAGGHGLNLTAADYVFILDPWWNPAVEMQAIDRAHRIGQTKPVFAYRLIAKGTVEEKIIELQQQKRELAEAIITADDRLLANLTADDLRMLLE